MPNRQRKARRTVRRTNAPRSTTSITRAVYSASIVTTAGGVYSGSYTPEDFGLGGAATFQVSTPQLVIGAGTAASFKLRLRNMRCTYTPFAGRSAVAGLGAGWATVLTTTSVPSISLNNVAVAHRSKPVYIGEPFVLNWKPFANIDKLWITSNVAQTSFLPVDITSSGASFVIYFSNGGVSATIGRLVFVFDIEIMMY
jgi:hypothetical protein